MKKINIIYNKLPYEIDEEMKSLRTNLVFCGDDKKVIMLTSCLPGEGKSQTSFNLAVSLAGIQKKVLLIDTDLRKSVMISRVENGKVDMGLTHFLSGQCALADIVVSTNIPRLHMVFSGPTVQNAAELLSTERFAKMLESLREIYDYIIIDSAPLGLVIDSAIVAQQCDGCMIVVESGKTKYKLVQEVQRQLEESKCPILGMIINKVSLRRKSKYYGREYKHYGNEYRHHDEDDVE